MEKEWNARLEGAPALVRPVTVDPKGEAGPTRGQVKNKGWRSSIHGFWVPTGTDSEVVEQRILEQSMRLGPGGAVTGWAALRLAGAAYFEGIDDAGGRLPVSLLSPDRQLVPTSESVGVRARLPDAHRTVLHGVPVATVERALIDEVLRLQPNLEAAILAVDMTCAARLTSKARVTAHLAARERLGNRTFVESVLGESSEWARSPREVWLRRVWRRQPGYPEPLCNRPVWSKQGALLGVPDLFDEEAGVVGEYDGAAHRSRARHRRDEQRRTAFANHAIEVFVLVAGDSETVAVARMQAARQRARWLAGPE